MAEFVQTMKDWRRMCKAYTTDDESCCHGCPVVDFHEHGCGAIFEMEDGTDWQRYADAIMAWAAEHQEPVYETWFEYLLRIGVIPKNAPAGGEYQWIVESIKHKHISNDIAESLKLHPKEG